MFLINNQKPKIETDDANNVVTRLPKFRSINSSICQPITQDAINTAVAIVAFIFFVTANTSFESFASLTGTASPPLSLVVRHYDQIIINKPTNTATNPAIPGINISALTQYGGSLSLKLAGKNSSGINNRPVKNILCPISHLSLA